MNKKVVIISVIIILAIISIPTAYKVVTNHQKNLYKVVNNKIIESAKRCYYDEVCQDEKITLEFLYQNNYLEEKVNDPVSKEYYNELSYVIRNDDNYEFVVVSWPLFLLTPIVPPRILTIIKIM